MHLLTDQDRVLLFDDSDLPSLLAVTKTQISYLEKQDTTALINFGDDSYSNAWLLSSARDFLKALESYSSPNKLNSYLQNNYFVYQAGGRKKTGGRQMLVTGYYEPVFPGSLTKTPPFLTPIYYPPSSLVSQLDEQNVKHIGRLDSNNKLIDYWSRAEIENRGLLRGYELGYLKDPVDAFLLHVQGSGRLQLTDGSLLSVRFAGSNGLEYKSIGKYLVDQELMELEEVTIPTIRGYLDNHPEQLKKILHHNPRFIFFHRGDDHGPQGSAGEILTPGRSIAVDYNSLPAGSIAFLTSQRPHVDNNNTIVDWTSINRFVFPQDSGSAIKGSGRVDMFWGNGDYAEVAANHMKEKGNLYFLIKKL